MSCDTQRETLLAIAAQLNAEIPSVDERGKYTFFPDTQESELLASINIDDLEQVCLSQPTMVGRFIHELWRIGRDQEIVILAERQAVDESLFITDIQAAGILMILMREADGAELCMKFLYHAITLIRKVQENIPLDQQLPDEHQIQILLLAVTTLYKIGTNALQISFAATSLEESPRFLE